MNDDAVSIALIRALPVAAVLQDAAGTVVEANERAGLLLGTPSRELCGRCIYDLFPHMTAAKRRERMERVARTGLPARFLESLNGRWLQLHACPVIEDGGRMVRLVVVIRELCGIRETLPGPRGPAGSSELHEFTMSVVPAIASMLLPEAQQLVLAKFGVRFDNIVRPEFGKRFPTRVQDPARMLDGYRAWLAEWLCGIGIEATAPSGPGETEIEISDCPWLAEARMNETFCNICSTMVMRSFRWTCLQGTIRQTARKTSGEPACRFDISLETEGGNGRGAHWTPGAIGRKTKV